jgi:hypothetical protein
VEPGGLSDEGLADAGLADQEHRATFVEPLKTVKVLDLAPPPLYKVGVVIGRLLRTVFLADYFVNPVFRREILRVLNRGEATNALKRLIYTGRVAGHQAKSQDEMQAVADALSLLANIVMAWNTVKMQAIFDRWAQSRSGAIPPELIARCRGAPRRVPRA